MSVSNSSRGRRGLPRGPHGLTPSEVARSQRERLLAAMTSAVADLGYTSTPVSEVIERAGVSRKTFYVHFRDRRECLIAAYELAAAGTLELVSAVARESEPGRARLAAVISALCQAASQSPDGCQLQVSEIAAAGQSALLAREELILSLGRMLRDGLGPGGNAPSLTMMGLIGGGVLRVIQHRVRDGALADPKPLAKELTRWAASYHPAPASIAHADGRASLTGSTALESTIAIGGRAPGTLSLSPKRFHDGVRGVSTSFTAHNQRERILDAVTNLSAEKGYVGLTVDDVAASAGVSLNTFYEHFKDKEDAFLVALELGHLRGTAILEQATSRATSWDAGVRDGINALFGFFYSESAFARLAAIEAPIASRQTAERARVHLGVYAQLLLDGAPRSRKPPPVASEAIAAALHAAVFAYAVHGVVRDLARAQSYAGYLVLAPFLGPNKVLLAPPAGADR
jgi:AcrR family transcriptional regulator